MSCIYLVKRGPRPDYHRAPFHPVIACGKRRIAKWEAGWTGDAAWVWSHERGTRGGGWLLERWNGFDVDYGHVVRGVTMPDGTEAGFVHQHTGRDPWPLLAGVVWWDDKQMPAWLAEAGAVYAPDGFSQQTILDLAADDGCSGFGRVRPRWWPVATDPDAGSVALAVDKGAERSEATAFSVDPISSCTATSSRATPPRGAS